MTNFKSSRSVWEVAVDCLSRRAPTHYELETRLKEKGFESSDIDRVLIRLEELGYLNDQELALMYSKSRLKRYSKRRVLHDLKNRGLAPQLIEQAIGETYSSDEEFRQCLSLAKSWWEQGSKHLERKNMETTKTSRFVPRELWLQQKVARRLVQRGYPSDMVRSALYEIQGNNG
ncbi:MAG: regulatory protein RecX [Bacillota bacterium]|nr:regulatory protein RecX [Bacillota bacterium]